jgi:hypothetical protein
MELAQLFIYTDGDTDKLWAGNGAFFAVILVQVIQSTILIAMITIQAFHPYVCDGSNNVDDDCDGDIDDGSGAVVYYTDADYDGYGTGTQTFLCVTTWYRLLNQQY